MNEAVGTAFARIGLLGNPSDGYHGQAIAVAIRNFRARVRMTPAERLTLVAPEDATADSLPDLMGALESHGCDDGLRLLRAAIHRFARHWPLFLDYERDDPRLRFEMRCETDIPRQVGLSGSSAIVIAALRALMAWFGVRIDPPTLAELALRAEVEDLGIAAGPMDRVIQCYEGVVHMNFAPGFEGDRYTRLTPGSLPPLYVAWNPERGAPSRVVHSDLRARFREGDADVVAAMSGLRAGVDRGLAALERRDRAEFKRLVDANFELRASVQQIADSDRELVEIGRRCGAAVKFCGSGGAVVGVLDDAGHFAAIEPVYRSAGFSAVPVEVADPRQ